MKIARRRLRLIEFFVVGIIMGIAEDLLAILLATDASVTPKVFLIVILVALPFAFISELVVDHPRFWEIFFKVRKNNK